MMELLREAGRGFVSALKNLLPVAIVVALFWFLVVGRSPDLLGLIVLGVVLAAAGIALFLQGLERGIFPLGRSLADHMLQKGSLFWLLLFAFAVGFVAVIAEPSLIVVATQAELISGGQIDALVLRLVVGFSVGLIVLLGVLRVVLGHPIRPYLIGGYILMVGVTLLTPAEITGLAYDAGAVSANIVTVPLLTAIGIGLAASLKGRHVLFDGFGLVGLAVMAPRLVVQLYGLAVFGFSPEGLGEAFVHSAPDASPLAGWTPLVLLADLWAVFQSVLPLIGVMLFFQFVVAKKPMIFPHRIIGGFILLILGLFLFVEGLKLGLLPVGEQMAYQLVQVDLLWVVILFVFLLGLSATLVEPALIAVAQKAQEEAPDRFNASLLRTLVAIGVGLGLALGVARIVLGIGLDGFLIGVVALLVVITLLAPAYAVALAYDVGPIATSDVTVPLIAALGIGLAIYTDGADPLLDGFGLVALASLMPVIVVMITAWILPKQAKKERKNG